jgi:hypothetical protein
MVKGDSNSQFFKSLIATFVERTFQRRHELIPTSDLIKRSVLEKKWMEFRKKEQKETSAIH